MGYLEVGCKLRYKCLTVLMTPASLNLSVPLNLQVGPFGGLLGWILTPKWLWLFPCTVVMAVWYMAQALIRGSLEQSVGDEDAQEGGGLTSSS